MLVLENEELLPVLGLSGRTRMVREDVAPHLENHV